jgi:hypothetical protein
MSEEDSLEKLSHIWSRLEAQHANLLFTLRKITKISIDFQRVEGRHHIICFEKSISTNETLRELLLPWQAR